MEQETVIINDNEYIVATTPVKGDTIEDLAYILAVSIYCIPTTKGTLVKAKVVVKLIESKKITTITFTRREGNTSEYEQLVKGAVIAVSSIQKIAGITTFEHGDVLAFNSTTHEVWENGWIMSDVETMNTLNSLNSI